MLSFQKQTKKPQVRQKVRFLTAFSGSRFFPPWDRGLKQHSVGDLWVIYDARGGAPGSGSACAPTRSRRTLAGYSLILRSLCRLKMSARERKSLVQPRIFPANFLAIFFLMTSIFLFVFLEVYIHLTQGGLHSALQRHRPSELGW